MEIYGEGTKHLGMITASATPLRGLCSVRRRSNRLDRSEEVS
jgi:hypothetical protein